MIKGVVFDIGQTLVEYHKPLNWSALYRPALEYAAAERPLTEAQYQRGVRILAGYNTRLHPREREVSSARIFGEILAGTALPPEARERFKNRFYGYFRQDAALFPEAEETLGLLAGRGLILATLSDVAYGMDNAFALADVAPLLPYIAFPRTSNDLLWRKPRPEGLLRLAAEMGLEPGELVVVGDEEKDMACALRAGVCPVLLCRDGADRAWGQAASLRSLAELPALLDRLSAENEQKIRNPRCLFPSGMI